MRLRPISNKRPRFMQGAHFQSHARSVNQHVQKVRGFRLLSLTIYLLFFTCVTPRIKSKWLPIDIPQHLSYTFYIRSTVYKKQGAPDGRPLDIYLMLFTHVAPRTKSKGLLIDVPYF
jgi:hypothetical protein